MNKNLFILAAILFGFSLVFTSCDDDDDDDDNNNSGQLTERGQIIKDYNDNYLGSTVADPLWTGSVAGCQAGTMSASANNKVIQRINYFRNLVGLPSVTFNSSQSTMCQEASLIFVANNNLSHYPASSWSCWTQAGYDAAGKSNIAWSMGYTLEKSNHGVNAVSGYIEDPGAGNEGVGHRAWILLTGLEQMGHGSAVEQIGGSYIAGDCLIWKDNYGTINPTDMPEFIAYPAEGYMPDELAYPRWSFCIPDANFTSTTVTMTKKSDGSNVSLSVVARESQGGSLPETRIVWEPSINSNVSSDVTYTVELTNVVVGGSPQTYTYDVTLVDVTPEFSSKSKGGKRLFLGN